MPYRNYINIPDNKREEEIYRIMPIHRLLEIFNLNKLTLVKPEMWDDPFENWLLKSYGRTADGKSVSLSDLRKSIFGQCWTLEKETDAMWRIYSHNKQGVKIKTTISRLLGAMFNSTSEHPELSCFIGTVKYLKLKEMKEQFSSYWLFDSDGSALAESLLFKRNEFKYEKEVRLVYLCPNRELIKEDIYQFTVNPYDLFDEIVFDPRINKYLFDAFKSVLKKKRFTKPIRQSALYKPPKELTIRI